MTSFESMAANTTFSLCVCGIIKRKNNALCPWRTFSFRWPSNPCCEKVFRPDLRVRPVIVLSNNDGCVIARSAEARALGIPMAAPWFKLKARAEQRGIVAFSSNYSLYHSMSERVMRCLEALSPRVEQYSIDEMFLDVAGIDACTGFEDFGRQLRAHVHRHTALTIGVGMGPTKTLAKSAQWASKQWKQFGGVLALTPGNPRRTQKLLNLGL